MEPLRTVAVIAFAFCWSFGGLAAAAEEVSKGKDPVSMRLNAWFVAGEAAGLDGVYYDNRDRKHSNLGIASYPQLKPITYSKAEIERRVDWGAQGQLLGGKIVIGNSSTASGATQAGSHQRMYYVNPRGLPFLYRQYRSNALYVYPEHRDHDPGTNGPDGHGDLYPANSPYLITSQGSSGTDRVFLHAFLKTIAAFPPETREALVAEGLLMPTLQAIFRQAYKASGDYLSGSSHPSAFDGKLIDEAAMVSLAHAMAPDAIPPLVKLRVLEEPRVEPGRDFFEPPGIAAMGERLGDSPCAIARVIRGPDFRRTMRVTAADSFDHLGGRPLSFRWVVLRGDPDLIRIEPAGKNGAEAEISVGYHPRRPIRAGSSLWSNRVDIGVFCETAGSLASAPAFISFTTLPNEHRTYAADDRLLEIFYGARNFALGMPPANDERWDHLLAREKESVAMKLLAVAMGETRARNLRTVAAETALDRDELSRQVAHLADITGAQKEIVDATNKVRAKAHKAYSKSKSGATKAALDEANARHNAANKAMREGADGAAALKVEITKRRAAVTSAIRGARLPESVRTALNAILLDPGFFSANEAAIREAVIQSANPKAGPRLEAALRELALAGVSTDEEYPPANDRYHLSQLHLEILSGILFPEFLERNPSLFYADPRLTAKKHWRDVYHYDQAGKRTGWTRYQDGKQAEFTAGGDLLRTREPDGSAGQPVKVSYQLNPQSKLLEAVAVE